jgi:thymidylate synthase
MSKMQQNSYSGNIAQDSYWTHRLMSLLSDLDIDISLAQYPEMYPELPSFATASLENAQRVIDDHKAKIEQIQEKLLKAQFAKEGHPTSFEGFEGVPSQWTHAEWRKVIELLRIDFDRAEEDFDDARSRKSYLERSARDLQVLLNKRTKSDEEVTHKVETDKMEASNEDHDDEAEAIRKDYEEELTKWEII